MKKRRKNNQKERRIQLQVCDWLKSTYPDLIFMCDMASGMRLSIGQAMVGKRMRSSKALPDLYIFHRGFESNYCGLVLELKKDFSSVYKKNGELRTIKHIKEQATILEKFRNNGFVAQFITSLEQEKELINNYICSKYEFCEIY